MTRETLDKLRAMGMNLGSQYDKLADILENNRKNDADNAIIYDIQVKTDVQKNDGKQYFIVKVTVSSDVYPNNVFVEIDGNEFQASRKPTLFELNAFYANVYVNFSTIVRLDENYLLTAKLKNSLTNQVTNTKFINVKVDNRGNASVTNDNEENVNNPKKGVVSIPTSPIKLEQLIEIGVSKKKANEYIDSLNKTLQDYNLITNLRIAHFLAQVMHESGSFNYTSEIGASNSDYEGFKGRGLIQLTGESNYTNYENYESEDFTSSLTNKQKLENPPYSVRSAGWFWSILSELNTNADENDFIYITRIINGGFNGYNSRNNILTKAFTLLKIDNNDDYIFKDSKAYNEKRASFAWGLWHDPDINKTGCTKDKDKAIEGYQRFIDLAPTNFSDTNWYGIKSIKEFGNIKYTKNKKTYVKIIDAANQRLVKLQKL